jgi:hypothetical protein
MTGGRAGSPRPVRGWPVVRKWTSTGGTWLIHRGFTVSKFVCITQPRSMVIACPGAAPWTWFSAPLGLMIWLPTLPATQT